MMNWWLEQMAWMHADPLRASGFYGVIAVAIAFPIRFVARALDRIPHEYVNTTTVPLILTFLAEWACHLLVAATPGFNEVALYLAVAGGGLAPLLKKGLAPADRAADKMVDSVVVAPKNE